METTDQLMETLTSVYDKVCSTQNESGKFSHPEMGYTVNGQFTGYYFAVLYTHPHQHNSYYKQKDVLKRAIKGWEYFYAQTNSEGFTRLCTFDKFLGLYLSGWGLYFWMNTLELLKPHLDKANIAKWSERIDVAMEQLIRKVKETSKSDIYQEQLAKSGVRNLFVWDILCCYRYGMIQHNEALKNDMRKEMESILSAQTTFGTWLESKTSVVMYGEVTISAVSLFAYYDKHEGAQKAVGRNLQYVLETKYPNFRKNDCLDGRTRNYDAGPVGYTAPTFCQYEAGKVYLNEWAQRVDEWKDSWKGIGLRLQGLALVTEAYAVLDAIENAPSLLPEVSGDDAGLSHQVQPVTRYDMLDASIMRQNGWIITICGMTQGVFGSPYALERQNLLSIYHEKEELLLGGGHSIAQPEFSSFNIISQGKLNYLHSEGKLNEAGTELRLKYGEHECHLSVESIRAGEVIVRYRVEDLRATERAYVHLPLPLIRGEVLWLGGVEITPAKERLSQDIVAHQPFLYKNLHWELSQHAVFSYPHIPFNSYSYRKGQKKPPPEVFGIIRVELSFEQNECMLTVRAGN